MLAEITITLFQAFRPPAAAERHRGLCAGLDRLDNLGKVSYLRRNGCTHSRSIPYSWFAALPLKALRLGSPSN